MRLHDFVVTPDGHLGVITAIDINATEFRYTVCMVVSGLYDTYDDSELVRYAL